MVTSTPATPPGFPADDARPARRRRGRPRGQDSAVVREAALRAAIDLIAEHGFAGTTMAQVADGAGISPSGLAHHFPSKTALLGAVLDYRDAMDSPELEVAGGEPWGSFDELAAIARINMERRPLVQLYTSMIGEAFAPGHPAHGWMRRHYETVVENLRDQLHEDQQRGYVSESAPCTRIARATVALMDGLQVQWLLDPSIDMGTVMEDHVDDLKGRWGTDPA